MASRAQRSAKAACQGASVARQARNLAARPERLWLPASMARAMANAVSRLSRAMGVRHAAQPAGDA